ncbi:MAG: sugar phosphate isomerase/epimerase [Chloroflexi bacterium]|nr:sugar phosphate isomerase/epimerase [Chloroflexota bacterium]
MKISLITDEISADLETAIELGVSWGVRDFELRSVGVDRVPRFPDYQKRRLKELLEEYQAVVIAISPGLFKCPFPGETRSRFSVQAMDHSLYQQWHSANDLVRFHREELLPESLEYAQEIGAKIVVIFSFQRDDAGSASAPDEIVAILQDAAIQAENLGLQLAVEVENGFWADSGEHTLDLLSRVDRAGLGVNWDPGNAFEAGDIPYPIGYRAIQKYLKHLHFKDILRRSDGKCDYAIEGHIDWAGQIKALVHDGYPGHISIETHMQPKVRSAELALQRLRFLVQSAGAPVS